MTPDALLAQQGRLYRALAQVESHTDVLGGQLYVVSNAELGRVLYVKNIADTRDSATTDVLARPRSIQQHIRASRKQQTSDLLIKKLQNLLFSSSAESNEGGSGKEAPSFSFTLGGTERKRQLTWQAITEIISIISDHIINIRKEEVSCLMIASILVLER